MDRIQLKVTGKLSVGGRVRCRNVGMQGGKGVVETHLPMPCAWTRWGMGEWDSVGRGLARDQGVAVACVREGSLHASPARWWRLLAGAMCT